MSEGFVEYYETFKDARADVVGLLKRIAAATGDKKTELLRDANAKLQELERYYRILEQEAKGGDAQEKRKMQSQLRVCHGDIAKLKSSLEKEALLGRPAAPAPRTAQEQAAAYQAGMDRTTNHLQDAKRTVAEIDEVAVSVDANLAVQREHLERAQGNVDETRADVQDAKSHLRSLARKAFSNLILLSLIILGLLAGIVYTLLYKFYLRYRH
ncbi:hypothetical protein SDRG_14188 [Saprolegnia diclina VS20]|uniref:t-SNARE coiled-coil homology domain-containing protein n=1 Tax=Saprolegnia diclina (strain VS20) TaxID=1156394 RepID=T0Q3U7_SAPDV|nr:hypothetical protein SDRG_14188 [Saprolegnia diclina VS20]EQC28095.1 hypothetical protein SDRG_14188 [Saprolegnia diclina VS20]|eukprot:XP_008618520.1 hypothetical protein SDRG_14188 [Saprolegnia diclina VS20]